MPPSVPIESTIASHVTPIRDRAERDRSLRAVRVGDEREAVALAESVDQRAHGGARMLDLVAGHRAGAVEHDDEIGRHPHGDAGAFRVGADREFHPHVSIAVRQHRRAFECAREMHGSAGRRAELARERRARVGRRGALLRAESGAGADGDGGDQQDRRDAQMGS